jgi:hypothetical protein
MVFYAFDSIPYNKQVFLQMEQKWFLHQICQVALESQICTKHQFYKMMKKD